MLSALIEVALVVAVGGMFGSAVLRTLRRRVHVPICGACGGVVSRAYPKCRHCGSDRKRS